MLERISSHKFKNISVAKLPTKYGEFEIRIYAEEGNLVEHAVLVIGDIKNQQDIITRVHSECLTGDVFGSERCDCGAQLDASMKLIAQKSRGVIIYLRGHEGRGIGLGKKIAAYTLQDHGLDTVEANLKLGLPVDSRRFDAVQDILLDLQVVSINLLTNNPDKVDQLLESGVHISEVMPLLIPANKNNKRYLHTKQSKLGHLLDLRD